VDVRAALPPAEVASLVERWPGVTLVVVFGSVPAGRARPDSDVDIGVLGGGFWDQLGLGSELGRRLGREPHVVDLATASDWLRFEVARGGILVFEKEAGTWPAFQAQAAVRYFDLAPMIALCADGVRRRLQREAGREG
jgi:predicted nucleotidyltransferase